MVDRCLASHSSPIADLSEIGNWGRVYSTKVALAAGQLFDQVTRDCAGLRWSIFTSNNHIPLRNLESLDLILYADQRNLGFCKFGCLCSSVPTVVYLASI